MANAKGVEYASVGKKQSQYIEVIIMDTIIPNAKNLAEKSEVVFNVLIPIISPLPIQRVKKIIIGKPIMTKERKTPQSPNPPILPFL